MQTRSAVSASRQHSGSATCTTIDSLGLDIRLYDDEGEPMPEAPYAIIVGGYRKTGKADQDGWVHAVLPPRTEYCIIRWGEPDADDPVEESFGDDGWWQPLDAESAGAGPTGGASAPVPAPEPGPLPPSGSAPPQGSAPGRSTYAYRRKVYVDLLEGRTDEEGQRECVRRCLHNLGYPDDEDLGENVNAFQRENDLPETGRPADVLDRLRRLNEAASVPEDRQTA